MAVVLIALVSLGSLAELSLANWASGRS